MATVAFCVGLFVVPQALADPLIVSNTADSGAGSLRQAIIDANALPGPTTIEFTPGGTFPITPHSALPQITGPVTISGSNATVVLDGSQVTGPPSPAVGLDFKSGIFASGVDHVAFTNWGPSSSGIGAEVESGSVQFTTDRFGSDWASTAAGNYAGILVLGGTATIGSPGTGNDFSNNVTGVSVSGGSATIEGNAFANNSIQGVQWAVAGNGQIGGTTSGDENTFAGPSGAGISFTTAHATQARHNSFNQVGGGAIQYDLDFGRNTQNAPKITSAVSSGGSLAVQGTLDSAAGTYDIDLFSAATCDASGSHGQTTATFLGEIDGVQTDGSGHAAFSNNAIPGASGVLVATATLSGGATSELSSCTTITGGGGSGGGGGGSGPPDPNTLDFAILSNIAINGTVGTVATVAPGTPLMLSASYSDVHPNDCPTCIDFIDVGWPGQNQVGCVENFGSTGSSGSGSVNLGKAPTLPGTYRIVAKYLWDTYCGQSWTAADSNSYTTIAEIVVSSGSADTAQTGPIFTVTTAADSDDGMCGVTNCSLREAINAANNAPGSEIDFAIGTGVQTIHVTSPLPDIASQVDIEGGVQPGVPSGSKGIVLQGTGNSGNGLVLNLGSDKSSVRGLAIQGFTGPGDAGILVNSKNNVIEDNYIGTTADGTAAAANSVGIDVSGIASGNTIGETGHPNVISGNDTDGVLVDASNGSGSNSVSASFIGTDPTGNAAIPNDVSVAVDHSNSVTVSGNVIYGATYGVDVEGGLGPDDINIQGNRIGVSSGGIVQFPNSAAWAVGINGGGDGHITDNIIGHAEEGLAIANTSGLTISGNYVGVDDLGNPEPNRYEGIYVSPGPSGGSATTIDLDDNTVRFNPYDGIYFQADDSTLQSNTVDGNGTSGLHGHTAGIRILGNGDKVIENTVTSNNGPGVAVVDPLPSVLVGGDSLSGNTIDNNVGLGIDLGDDGHTANDQQGHSGPNTWQDYPTLTKAGLAGGQLAVDYSLPTPGGEFPYTIEFFGSTSCTVGNEQGAELLGTDTLTSGQTGSKVLSGAAVSALQPGNFVTATATDMNFNTSEFSACFAVTGSNSTGGAISLSEDKNHSQNDADLTANGNEDWAIWGYANGGFSTSLAPDVRKANGAGISNLTQTGATTTPGAFGEFAYGVGPLAFNWTDGTPVATATGATGGLAPRTGSSFSFRVPADTSARTLRIWVSAHYADGTLAATLSDGSAQPVNAVLSANPGDVAPVGGENIPDEYTIQYHAGSANQNLTITWTQTANNGGLCGCDDAVLYAAALSDTSASLTGDASVEASGSNDQINALPLDAFAPAQSDVTPQPINGLPINALPINGLPINGLPINGLPINGLPINGLPINALPINGLPINGLPINGLPINGLPINGLPINALPINGLTIGGQPANWTTILAGTTLAGKPLQTITLQDVLKLNPQPSAVAHLTIGDLSLGGDSDLGNVTIGALALGSTPINALGTTLANTIEQQLTAWCQSVVTPASNCTSSAIGNASLFSLGLAGAPINGLPINALPINALPINGLPINALPINGLPINGLFLAASPINGLPIKALPINGLPINGLGAVAKSAVFDCTKIDCTTATLRVAGNTPGAIKPGVTVGQLLSLLLGTGSPVKTTLTLGDLVSLVIDIDSMPWETLSPRLLAAFDPNRPAIQLTAGFRADGTGTGPVDVKIALPPGFDYVTGSASLTQGNQDSTNPGDPTIDGNPSTTGETLDWQLPAAQLGVDSSIAFSAVSGSDVGPVQLTETVTGPEGTASSVKSLNVTDGFAGNDSAGDAATITPDQSVQMSAILSADDVDYYKVQLPAAGTRIEVHLANLNADYDLALYANQTTSVRTGSGAPNGIPLQDGTVPDEQINLAGGANSNSQLTPTALQDVPDPDVPGLQIVQVSANRGTDDEDVGMVSPGGAAFAYIAVFGYNGASSSQPYTLRVTTTPPQTPSCTTARSFPFPTQGTAGTLPSTLPTNLNTVFLVNEKRLGQTYGTTAESNVVNSLNSLTGRADLGVSGAVIPVEGIGGVPMLYSQWDSNPCNNGAANAVANAIADQVDAIKQARPTLKYVVFVGGDDEIPFFRLPDLSLIANESGFASQFSNNEYYGALSAGDLLSDNPYLDTRPVPASGRQLFVPDLVGGRLVETPTDITNAVSNFLSSGGTLRSSTAFVSGYDFVADGSQAVASRLSSVLGSGSVKTLIDSANPFVPASSWTKAQLLANAFPTAGPAGINDWNGHYDNTRALMANGTDILSTSELTGTHALKGGVFFTMGCHAGFQTTDAIVGSPVLDWAQEMAATGTGFVGNTGFGLGNTDSVAFSEELMADLASHLDGTVSLGQALVQAKQDYFITRDAFSSYDEKTLSEAELYGLPMYGVGTPPAPLAQVGAPNSLALGASPAVSPAVMPDPVPGATSSTSPSQGVLSAFAGSNTLQAAAFSANPAFTGPTSGQHGQYLTNAGQVQAPNYRPLQPYVSLPATRSGLYAHGVVIDGLTSADLSPFNPDNVRPTLDLSKSEPEPTFTDEAWPSKIPTLVTLSSVGGQIQQLNLITGQFFTDTSGSAPVGVERKWTHIDGRVIYTSDGTDFTPPTIDRIDAFTTGTNVIFTGQFDDTGSQIVFAQVVYDLNNSTTWNAIQLQHGSGSNWSGSGSFTGTKVQFFVEVCDAAGNCGYSSNKGRYFNGQPLPTGQQGSITIAPTTAPPPGGIYAGPVTLTAVSSTGAALTESLDGAQFVPYPAAGVAVSGDGPHTLDVKGSDGSEATSVVQIDTGKPVVTINDPTTVPYGAAVPFLFSCSDAGSGISSCTGAQNGVPLANGENLNTLTLGTLQLTAAAQDKVGNSATAVPLDVAVVKATPTITWATPAPITFGTKLSATQLNASASNAGTPVAGTFTYTPALNAMLQPGIQTLNATFTPSDNAHYTTASASVQIVVTFSQGCLTGTLSTSLTIKSGQVYCVATGGKITGSVTVQSGGTLWVSGGTLSGSLTSTGAKGIQVCGATVVGSVSITGSTGAVTLGATGACAADKLQGSVTLSNNTAGVSIVGDTISGSVTATGNSGGVVFTNNTESSSVTLTSNTGGLTVGNDKITGSLTATSNAGGATFNANTIGGSVSISSNTGGVTITSNTVKGSLTAQNNKGGFTYPTSGPNVNHVSGSVTLKNNS